MNLLEKQRNQHHDIGFLIINIQANRVAIVSSVTTKYMQVFDYSVYFSVLVLKLYSRYLDSLNNNHLADNNVDSTIFVMV